MSAVPGVAAVLRTGGPQMATRLERLEARLGELVAGHGELLARHATDTIAAGGKRLRPLLVFLAAGEEADPDGALRAAVAVELVHSATLVHDDVLDAAPLRRGRPTVVATGGREVATATGDLLFSRAFAELARNRRADELRVLSAAGSDLARGELQQRADAWDVAVPLERYLGRCELKTASLFEAACRLGALEAGGPVEGLGAFGRRVGLAFQLLDDVLDVTGPVERTGKPRGTDLLDGTVTLPLILAREHDPALAALDLRAVRTPEEADRLCDRIAATGVLDAARARALEIVAQAKADLPPLDPVRRTAFDLVAEGVVERYA
jgi:geranylgeranyl pyrophosphate synthase